MTTTATPRAPSATVPVAIIVGALSFALAGIGGFLLGSHTQDTTVTRQDKQIEFCGEVADFLKDEATNAVDMVAAGDDVEKVQAQSDVQDRLGQTARNKFGTDYVPALLNRCKNGG